MSNIKFLQLNQQKSVNGDVVKTSWIFFLTVIIYSICVYTCVCADTELRVTHTHTQNKKWRKNKRGRHEATQQVYVRGNKRVRKAATSPLLETNINLSSKKYIYNLTYIFTFRPKHKSLIRLPPPPPKHVPLSSFRTVDTLVKLSFRSITGPLLHMRLRSGSVLAANKSLLLNASFFCLFQLVCLFVFFRNYVWFLIYFRMKKVWYYCHSSADKKIYILWLLKLISPFNKDVKWSDWGDRVSFGRGVTLNDVSGVTAWVK